ncbi:MAG: thioredoxin-disulfide reductase [Chloroflexi bacterium]|nr:thioredoxin-disulfide reductase [Chloroflexota bacterium]
MQHEKVIVIGSGPAGLTAALYTARAQLNPLVIVGPQLGGQVAITHEVENYPGFPEGLSGPDLVEKMRAQAERFGARYEYASVSEVDFTHGRPFTVKTDNGKILLADSVVVTSGASPRKLQIPGEDEYVGRGVSYCGTCDGFFFRGKDIVVVGGGDSALEEGIFLTRFANKVEVIHRRDELRAGPFLQKRAFNNEKMSFVWNTVIDEIAGEGAVDHIVLRDVNTGETRQHPTEGVFIFIGHEPNNSIYKDQLEMDEEGYVITDKLMRTSVEGVFAAGEIQDPIYRQVGTSVGQGTAAAMSLERWLSETEAEEEETPANEATPELN